jgi:hypothetical protein
MFSAPAHQSPFAGQATFTGGLAIVGIATESLTSRLPSATVLPVRSAVFHPCLLAFGKQRNGTTFFGGLPVSWGVEYHELLVGVPFVRLVTDHVDRLFVLGMSCDFWPAIWNGNYYYGFRKRFAAMRWADDVFTVTGHDGRQELHASLSEPDREAASTFELIRALVTQPVLGCRGPGGFVHARFDWDFSTAVVERASLRLSLSAPFQELTAPETMKVMGEAYRVRGMRWRLSFPLADRQHS